MKYKTIEAYRKAMVKLWGKDAWIEHERFEFNRLREFLAAHPEKNEVDRLVIQGTIADLEAEIKGLGG